MSLTSSPSTRPPVSPGRVLVLGARGRLGQAAVRAFADAGWDVVAHLRPGAVVPASNPRTGVRWVQAAFDDTAALAAAAAGATVVVQGLSPVYEHRAWRTWLPRFTQAGIDVAAALGATLLVPGSVYNYGRRLPAVLAEDTPQQPDTFKGRMRHAMERQLQQAAGRGVPRVVVLRAGDYFGSSDGSWFDRVIANDLRAGRFTYPGPLGVATPWAYLPDLARTFVRVAERREALPAFACLHFAGHERTGADWLQALDVVAGERGWRAPGTTLRVAQVPWLLWRALGFAVPVLAALSEMRHQWRTPHRLANARLVALIGDEPRTPFDIAVRTALDDLGMVATATAPAAADSRAAIA